MNEGIFLVNMRLSFLYLIKHRPLLPLLIMSFLNCATIAFVGGEYEAYKRFCCCLPSFLTDADRFCTPPQRRGASVLLKHSLCLRP
ncbi:Uncharacterised protein [Bacteroides heparinolyticus]|uniref:Uncharacterized protein n=1 Tax=Prevotella heparinolytica TaxID=28113 RepID=A0A449I2X1_9BACE|nr:Uncharacterised protein [Bacteroides heparinolyticus]